VHDAYKQYVFNFVVGIRQDNKIGRLYTKDTKTVNRIATTSVAHWTVGASHHLRARVVLLSNQDAHRFCRGCL
jgi:hypothetical protein